jgi:hypothetical protein
MALVVKDRVQETSTTTGTGTFTLAGAVTGFDAFSVIGDGNTTYYAIVGGSQWEVGLGTYTLSGTTLARTTVLSSSTGGSAVDFSAGIKNVFVTYPAGKSVYLDSSNNVTFPGNILSTGTGALGLPSGTTAERPSTPVNGYTRINTTLNIMEVYVDGRWEIVSSYGAPDAPTIGTATATGSTSATVSFTAPLDNGNSPITSYTAVSSPGGITGTLSQAGSGTITVNGLTTGTSYTFVVFATNAAGNSANSSASNSITTFSVPGAPTIGTATATGSTSATVAYTAPASNGGSVITSYTAVSSPGSITGTLSQAGSGTITVNGLSAGTSYTFVVFATNAIGNSANSSASNSITTPSIASYVVVAGGGGGGSFQSGGGGGAGGYLSGTFTLATGTTYTATVGGGGAAGSSNGANSSLSGTNISATATGGGAGGNTNAVGASGGSGGGGSFFSRAGGSGTSGQGNTGGTGSGSNFQAAGGGGGASAIGGNGTGNPGGAGGAGSATSITGSSVTYAGGGGGGGSNQVAGSGGAGGAGGGAAGGTGMTAPSAASANTGGGGGGGSGRTCVGDRPGSAGGSGIVILAVPTSVYTGTVSGTFTTGTSGSNTWIRWTASGTYSS